MTEKTVMKSPSKTYLLFAGGDDWIEGGAWDLEGAYETETEARTAFRKSRDDWDWADVLVVDGLETEIISSYRKERGWRTR